MHDVTKLLLQGSHKAQPARMSMILPSSFFVKVELPCTLDHALEARVVWVVSRRLLSPMRSHARVKGHLGLGMGMGLGLARRAHWHLRKHAILQVHVDARVVEVQRVRENDLQEGSCALQLCL